MAIRVCHVTSVHPAKDARIFYKECASLAKVYDVYLIAPNVHDEVVNGVHIVGVELPKSRLKRITKLGKVYRKALSIEASIYHIHDPELMTIGVKLQRGGKKVVFDSHEDVPAQFLSKQYIPQWMRKPISKAYAFFEKINLRRYDALISVTPQIVDRLRTINKNVYQITNYPIYQERMGEHLWQNQVCFTGLLSPKWMLDSVIECVNELNASIIIAGNDNTGSYIQHLLSLAKNNNVLYRGVVKREEVFDIHRQCVAGLAVESYRSSNANYKKGSLGMTKALEYMMSGIPVVISDTEIWGGIIRKYQCGICVDPDNKDEIIRAISYYINNKEEAKRHGENGRKAVKESFNWSSQEHILFDLYAELINQ